MEDAKSLYLIEIFSSVQGETSAQGLPTTFVRLAACNLRCTWCDTTYSFVKGTKTHFNEIFYEIDNNGHKHVCVTGGEPLLQKNVYPLMTQLCDAGRIVSLETGGSLPIDLVDPRVITILDIKCPGSGMSEKNHLANLKKLRAHDEVKFVILDESDYLFARDICKKFQLFERDRSVLLSPVFGSLDPKQLVGWMLRDKLPVRLNLQTHKFIWDANTRGV